MVLIKALAHLAVMEGGLVIDFLYFNADQLELFACNNVSLIVCDQNRNNMLQ